MGNRKVSARRSGGRLTDHLSIGVLTRTVPRYVIDEVLAETGCKEQRSRLLPAHVVVYFVLSLALFADGYDEVMRQLVHGLRFARTWSRSWQVPLTSAMSQARGRLGEAPLKELFARLAVPLATAGTPGAWLGRWRLMAIDGVMLDIAETDANLAVYEKSDGGTRRPYPQVKIVGLGEAGSHAIIDAGIGSIRQGERELAEPLTRSLSADMLVLADRGFFSYSLWRSYLLTGAALLWRLSKTTALPVLQVLPDGSYLSEIKAVKGQGKTGDPARPDRRPDAGHPHPGPGERIPDQDRRRGHRRPGHPARDRPADHHDPGPRPGRRAHPGRRLRPTLASSSPRYARSNASSCSPATPCGQRTRTPSARRSGGCCCATTRSGPSCTKPPTPSSSTRTEYQRSERSTSSAGPSATRRDFPPAALSRQRRGAISELLERLNPPRRRRTYPRVHKRGNRHSFPTKTPQNEQQHRHPPAIIIQRRDAA